MMEYLAIDVGGTFIKFARMRENGEIIKKEKIRSIYDTQEHFFDCIQQIWEKFGSGVNGVAISIPGLIDTERGFMYTGGYLQCLKNTPLVQKLENRYHVPVTIGNDAKCAALAEVWKGALSDVQDGMVVVIGTGIGGAVIHNHEILNGAHFLAGEFSYMMPEPKETLSIYDATGFTLGVPGLISEASKQMNIPKKNLNGEKIFEAANHHDAGALEALHHYCRKLALQISNIRFVTDPERIAIGGGISEQPLLLEILGEEMKNINSAYEEWGVTMPDLTVCRYHNDANLIGALYLHLTLRGKMKKESSF